MDTRQSHQPDPDTPVEIRGYKTDPLRRGYQILWNYENLYWRALVGSDAWSLYEVLRSFCHEKNPVCYPSINLLVAILGLKERRVITGRITNVNGKEYKYPGLIDALQSAGLVVAEVEGEGPKMRYIFHLDLTPGLLSDEQLGQLPEILQKKHGELLERCETAKQELQAKRKPSKVEEVVPETGDNFSGGSGNLPEGSGNLPEGSGNLPDEHYQKNNTKKTTEVVRKKIKKWNVSDTKFEKIMREYSLEYVAGKVELLEWKLMLQERGKQRRGRPITDPAGWLVRAIENDYEPPKAFFEYQEQFEEMAQLELDEADSRCTSEIDRLRSDRRLAKFMEQYETSQQEIDLWKQVLAELMLQMAKSTFETWLAPTHLFALEEDGRAVIGVANNQARDWVQHRLADKIKKTVGGLVDHPVEELEFVVIRTADDLQRG